MLENWLKPLKITTENLPDWQLGQHIDIYDGEFPVLKNTNVALLGTGESTNTIRQIFYQLAYPFENLVITDIGNLHKPTDEFLIPVVRELLDNRILPVIISDLPEALTGQFKSYQNIRQKIRVASIHQELPGREAQHVWWHELQEAQNPMLDHIGFVGYQRHLSSFETLSRSEVNNFELLRLGAAKAAMEQVEPTLRAADSVIFNLSAVKHADAPGCWYPTPSGFTSEEICQLAHYAGMSDGLTSIGFYGYEPNGDINQQAAHLMAHLVWYTLQGVYNRKQDFPVSTEGMMEYIVSFKEYDHNATFWKSTRSGRWWIQVEAEVADKHELIPCSYEDYQSALQNDLSPRLMNVMERYFGGA